MVPGRKSKVTPELYATIVAAWLQNPSPVAIAKQLGCSRRLVERLAAEGAPELGLGPLPAVDASVQPSDHPPDPTGGGSLAARIALTQKEAEQYLAGVQQRIAELEREAERAGVDAGVQDLQQRVGGTLERIEHAKQRVELDSRRLAVVEQRALVADATQKSADEVVAARMILQHTLTAGAIFGHLANRILGMIEQDRFDLPEMVSQRMIGSLMGSIERLANATDKAIKIEERHANAGEEQVTISPMHALLQQCTPDELEFVRQTGRLPQRLRFSDD